MRFCLLCSSTSPACSWMSAPSTQCQIIPWSCHSVEKDVCSRLVPSGTLKGKLKRAPSTCCLLVRSYYPVFVAPVYLFYRAQPCKFGWNCLSLSSFFSGQSNLVFRVVFHVVDDVIVSWGWKLVFLKKEEKTLELFSGYF